MAKKAKGRKWTNNKIRVKNLLFFFSASLMLIPSFLKFNGKIVIFCDFLKIKIPHHLWIILLRVTLWMWLLQYCWCVFVSLYFWWENVLIQNSIKCATTSHNLTTFHTIKCKKLHQIDIFPCYVVSHKVRYDQTQKCIKAAKKVTEKVNNKKT